MNLLTTSFDAPQAGFINVALAVAELTARALGDNHIADNYESLYRNLNCRITESQRLHAQDILNAIFGDAESLEITTHDPYGDAVADTYRQATVMYPALPMLDSLNQDWAGMVTHELDLSQWGGKPWPTIPTRARRCLLAVDETLSMLKAIHELFTHHCMRVVGDVIEAEGETIQ